MIAQSTLVLCFASVAVLGVILPRAVARWRLARAVQRGLEERTLETQVDRSNIADYHGAIGACAPDDSVDDATWTDLDLDAVFSASDRTVSQIGRQYLYNMIRRPQFGALPLDRVEVAIQRFAANAGDAAEVRRSLVPLADHRAAHLTKLLFGELPTRPTYWVVFPVLSTMALACLAAIPLWPKAAVVWLAVCAANIAVQMLYRPRVRQTIVAFQSVPALILVAERLAHLGPSGIEDEVTALQEGAPQLASLKRATSWLLFEPGTANELASTIYEYVNLLFLIDINAFVFSLQRISEARALMRRVYDAIGRIDAAQSIARWREALPYWAIPEFTGPTKSLRVMELYHPLLARPVANTLATDGASVLVTGSNMAGKTTFMRTLGVNAILAQAVHTVCARQWTAPFLQVRSSIGRTDSLLDGKSHYLAEVESVQSLLRAKNEARQHLFLLDEMFRGTNTAERVAAAYAVLKYLSQGSDLVVVASHDLELVSLLGASYDSYHFRESVTDSALSFDYLLRPGPSSTRNAIALLALKQYPEAIIADALAVLDRAGTTYTSQL